MLHCSAANFAETNWGEILRLYDVLVRIDASPIVKLNRAIVVAHLGRPGRGYSIDRTAGRNRSAAGLSSRRCGGSANCIGGPGNFPKARQHFAAALTRAQSEPDRELLQGKLDGVPPWTADEFPGTRAQLARGRGTLAHGSPGLPDCGKIFATLGPGEAWGMVKLTPAEQGMFIAPARRHSSQSRARGGSEEPPRWCGIRDESALQALTAAWRNTAPRNFTVSWMRTEPAAFFIFNHLEFAPHSVIMQSVMANANRPIPAPNSTIGRFRTTPF